MPSSSPAQRSIAARIAAHSLHAKHDPRKTTTNARAAARSALDARLLAEIDPDGKLSDAERARRLEHARKAHFARLALKSAKTRSRNAQRTATEGKSAAEKPEDGDAHASQPAA